MGDWGGVDDLQIQHNFNVFYMPASFQNMQLRQCPHHLNCTVPCGNENLTSPQAAGFIRSDREAEYRKKRKQELPTRFRQNKERFIAYC
ncbi:hypothetical protein Peur_045061 [Populus x canadensis]